MKDGKIKIVKITVINKENGEVVCEWEEPFREINTVVSFESEVEVKK